MDGTDSIGSTSHYADYLSMKTLLDEVTAQLETLQMLGRAIKQERLPLAGRQGYIAKIEMTIQFRFPASP